MSCLAVLDTVALQLNEPPSSTHQLPMFTTFAAPFDSTPFMIVPETILCEDMPTKPQRPLAKCIRRQPKRLVQTPPSDDRFQTLPPLPDIPTLVLPSFSHFNEPCSPLRRRFIPRLEHPNSPYVPWSDPMREEILPNPSLLDDLPSECFSRSGARAPEPPLHQPFRAKVRQLCHRVRSALSRHLGLCRERTTYPSPTPSDASSSEYEPSLASVSDTYSFQQRPWESTESIDSCSLENWLETRRRQQQQHEWGPGPGGMTLEEYDRQGSWLNLSHTQFSSKTSSVSGRQTDTPSIGTLSSAAATERGSTL